MMLRMWALILVDKVRTWLLESLAKSVTTDNWDEEEPNTNFIDPQYYLDDKAKMMTLVDQKLLASLVIFTCFMSRNGYDGENPDAPILTIQAGADEDHILLDGTITMTDLVELATCADVDHVVDFLINQDTLIDHDDPDPA